MDAAAGAATPVCADDGFRVTQLRRKRASSQQIEALSADLKEAEGACQGNIAAAAAAAAAAEATAAVAAATAAAARTIVIGLSGKSMKESRVAALASTPPLLSKRLPEPWASSPPPSLAEAAPPAPLRRRAATTTEAPT